MIWLRLACFTFPRHGRAKSAIGATSSSLVPTPRVARLEGCRIRQPRVSLGVRSADIIAS
jgi:hypothetical protein